MRDFDDEALREHVVAVVGSRNYKHLRNVDEALDGAQPTMVVSGGAKGPDSRAARWARSNGVPLVEHIPDWKKHGKRAGFIRNGKIVEGADLVLAFWDGESHGTLDSIKKAIKAGVLVGVVPDVDPER